MIEVCMCLHSRPERLSLIKRELEDQTYKDFRFNVWDNTKHNHGSAARFKLVKETIGNPIIFIDDDLTMRPDFVEYMYQRYLKYPDAIQGWHTRTFKDKYWEKMEQVEEGKEVDYVGTGGMILDRKIIDEEPILQNLPEEFAKVEDLYLCYLARRRGQKLLSTEKKVDIIIDNNDQYQGLIDYKENAFQKLREMGWALLKDKQEFELGGKKVWLDTSGKSELRRRMISGGEFYEQGLLDFAKSLNLGKAIVDVGANIGGHTTYFGMFCPYTKIYSFEPTAEARRMLERNISLNNVKNVEVFPYAVGEKEGTCDIEHDSFDTARNKVKEGSSVRMVALDDIVKEPISLIKIDVEGYELSVLKGAKKILEQHPYLIVEASTEERKKAADEYLATFGYQNKAILNRQAPTYFYEAH